MKIPVAQPELGEEELKNVVQAVESGWISSKGEFHRVAWKTEDGFVQRSADNDLRNEGHPLSYTSLILDAFPETKTKDKE